MATEVRITVKRKGGGTSDIRDVKERYEDSLLEIDGIWSVGIGKNEIMVFTSKDISTINGCSDTLEGLAMSIIKTNNPVTFNKL